MVSINMKLSDSEYEEIKQAGVPAIAILAKKIHAKEYWISPDPLQIKVILDDGCVSDVLKNDKRASVEVKIVDNNSSYEDNEQIEEYRDQLYVTPAYVHCNFTSVHFCEGEDNYETDDEDNLTVNTKVSYLYRDEENTKVFSECIVKGRITEQMQAEILACLDMAERFVPSQVGMPENTCVDDGYEYSESIDVPWHEFSNNGFTETYDPPTIPMTAQELVNAFRACKNKWCYL